MNRAQALVAMQTRRLMRCLGRVAAHRILTCLGVGVLAMLLRAAALPLLPIPEPVLHDEYSYLLGGETFAAGRLTNPAHPLWVHFETLHVLSQPTYMTKYPPGQSLFLALGQMILGHPWFGVWISFGLMLLCLCWMLQGWMPPLYAMVGALVGLGQIGVFSYWMNSYWGGAVAAAGGCLVLGALPRLARRPGSMVATLGAVGLVVVANTRPYEGLVLVVASGLALLWWSRRLGTRARLFRAGVLIPALLVMGLGAGWGTWYNYRVTGDPLLMPIVAHGRAYDLSPKYLSPKFVFMPAGDPPEYRHEEIRRVHEEFEQAAHEKNRRNPLRRIVALFDVLPFYGSTLLLFAAAAGMLLSRSPKVWIPVAVLGALWMGLLVENHAFAHYIAPGTGLLLIPALSGLRRLRSSSRALGPAFVALVLVVAASQVLNGFQVAYRTRLGPPPFRAPAAEALSSRGPRHLVIVRYGADHNIHTEYVYNRADIDQAPIVWARDMGEARNQDLLEYYPDRRIWLLEPDLPTPRLVAYPGPVLGGGETDNLLAR